MTETSIYPAVITEADQILLDNTKKDFAEILAVVKTHMVTDDASMEKATDMVSLVKKGLKAVEARRKELVAPLNDQVKQINSIFNGLKEQGGLATEPLTRQMSAHLQKKEREARKAELERKRLEQEQLDAEKAELEELEALGDDSAKTELAVNAQKSEDLATDRYHDKKPIARGQVGRASMVKGPLTIQVLDIHKVPIKYLVVDESKVRAAWNSGTRNIEGLKLEQKQSLRTA